MKHYPKIYEDVSPKPSDKIISRIGSSFGSVDTLISKFRSFYRDAHIILFDLIVKEVWLEQKFLYNGTRRCSRSGNGFTPDKAFSYFTKNLVGISQKPLTTGAVFVYVPTFFIDFFPNFSDHDPFEEPEYFKYPYEHVTLDHLSAVYQCDDRMEMLKEAEDKKMNINDFTNWAINHALSYKDEKGRQIYTVVRNSYVPYIKKEKYGRRK